MTPRVTRWKAWFLPARERWIEGGRVRVLVTKLQIFLMCVGEDPGTPVGLHRSGVLQAESVEETPMGRKALGANQKH